MRNVKMLVPFLLAAASCSEPPKPALEIQRSHKYDVSVYSGGKEIKDFNTALVQRISLTPAAVKALGNGKALPVDGISERDRQGKVTGVRIVTSKRGGNPALYGLREKDLLTAVGMKPVQRIEDLRLIASDLQREKSSSITLERNGKPHKIFYFLPQS